MFHTAVYLGFDARIVHMFLDFIHNLMDKRLPGVLTERQFFRTILCKPPAGDI